VRKQGSQLFGEKLRYLDKLALGVCQPHARICPSRGTGEAIRLVICVSGRIAISDSTPPVWQDFDRDRAWTDLTVLLGKKRGGPCSQRYSPQWLPPPHRPRSGNPFRLAVLRVSPVDCCRANSSFLDASSVRSFPKSSRRRARAETGLLSATPRLKTFLPTEVSEQHFWRPYRKTTVTGPYKTAR
jgi:hypothetical protein